LKTRIDSQFACMICRHEAIISAEPWPDD
jgi:hypothetical protein